MQQVRGIWQWSTVEKLEDSSKRVEHFSRETLTRGWTARGPRERWWKDGPLLHYWGHVGRRLTCPHPTPGLVAKNTVPQLRQSTEIGVILTAISPQLFGKGATGMARVRRPLRNPGSFGIVAHTV